MNVVEELTVDVPPGELYALYCDLERWPEVLDDVQSVEVLYADGYQQEFTMTVSRPGGPETVRGVRYCRGRALELCQFTTPPALSRMRGVWTFDGPPQGPTTVRAEREFVLRDPDADEDRFAGVLRGFLRHNLESFGEAARHAHR
ncbi:SRPBCC family protein [Kribbella sp. CA-253562]|jgi:hypothetical protein|uniref:SRPBCC family protein n=1 Tax=Kribbella sp. CA-253562 TaxID=3239942 RepID=UPI003D8B758E